MVTMVGLNTETQTLVKDLVALEYDAVAAYYEAMKRFDSEECKLKFHEFVTDHKDHLFELTKFAEHQQFDVPTEKDAKAILTTGKIMLADMIGDSAILKAMVTNENDTVTAYERAYAAEELPDNLRAILQKGLADEQRHREWMKNASQRDFSQSKAA